jgi:hypothetical protein
MNYCAEKAFRETLCKIGFLFISVQHGLSVNSVGQAFPKNQFACRIGFS